MLAYHGGDEKQKIHFAKGHIIEAREVPDADVRELRLAEKIASDEEVIDVVVAGHVKVPVRSDQSK